MMESLAPAVPGVLAELKVDKSAADFKPQFALFAKKVERLLAQYQVSEYVIARKDEGTMMHLVVFPCAAEPEERAPASEGPPAADASPASLSMTAEVGKDKSARGIGDLVERVVAKPIGKSSGPRPAAGLKPGASGVGIRPKRR